MGWDAYIDVHGNRYSVPAECCGQRVNIRISLAGERTVYDLRGQVGFYPVSTDGFKTAESFRS